MNSYKTERGFTLVEILVVIAIIGILSNVVLAQVKTARDKALVAKATIDLNSLEKAIYLLANDTEEWPGHQQIGNVDSGAANNEIWDLTSGVAGIFATDGLFPGWDGPYFPGASSTDPWGNNYFFDSDYDIGTSTEIWVSVVGSFGPNGVGQNVYDSDNIVKVLSATSS